MKLQSFSSSFPSCQYLPAKQHLLAAVFMRTLLAWPKRIRRIGKPNISTDFTSHPTGICMLSPISVWAFRWLFGCNCQLYKRYLAFRSTRSNAVHQFRDVHIPQRFDISMLFEYYLGNSVWTGKRTTCWCRCSVWERCSNSGQLRKEKQPQTRGKGYRTWCCRSKHCTW